MEPTTILRSPPVLALATIATQRLLTRETPTSAPTTALGAAVALAGATLAAAGAREIRAAGTTLDPIRPQDTIRVVRTGVYRYTRNPMYLGVALVLAGHAIHRRGLLAAVPVVGFVGLIDTLQIPAEEDAMLERFGSSYGDFVATVRRWF